MCFCDDTFLRYSIQSGITNFLENTLLFFFFYLVVLLLLLLHVPWSCFQNFLTF